MSNKSRRIPTISKERLDLTQGNTIVGTTKEEQRAQKFIKGLEPTHAFTLRLPVSMYEKLRTLAFESNLKMTRIVLDALKEHLMP